MNFFRSIIIMFSLYTKIPMPFINWDRYNTRYVMTVLPLSGLLIGAAEALWFFLALLAGVHAPLYAAVACAIVPFINGGIHIDGLADTADALASHMPAAKKREILADPHTGAFGAAAVAVYELLLFGLFCEIFYLAGGRAEFYTACLIAAAFTAPRALTQIFTAVVEPSAEKGMLYTMTSVADRKINIITACAVLVCCALPAVFCQGLAVLLYAALGAVSLIYCGRTAVRQFGGVSGDLCGWQIKISEAVFLASLVITARFM